MPVNQNNDLDNTMRLTDHFINRLVIVSQNAVTRDEIDPVSSLVLAKKVQELFAIIKEAAKRN